MKVAVLPFSPAEGTNPALGRQLASFAAEMIRAHSEADINPVSYLTQVQAQDGSTRMAFAVLTDALIPDEQLSEMMGQFQADLAVDGVLRQTDDKFELTIRFTEKGVAEPVFLETRSFATKDVFTELQYQIKLLASKSGVQLPPALAGDTIEFGTTNPEAFLSFREGCDALSYIQQANGMVAVEFSPQPAMDALLAAVALDPAFAAPYQVLVQLARNCAHFRIGSFESAEAALVRLTQLVPTHFLAFFALGELHQTVNSLTQAAEYYERALSLDDSDPTLFSRLGAVQLAMGMPINAERNFRKAFAMEGEDKPSGDYLGMVLGQTGRGHEVPPLWKSVIDNNPQNAQAHAKYAVALFQAGKAEEAEKAFEYALEILEDNTVVKRFYAPWLVKKDDLDRAMDFYEDVLDIAPNEIAVLTEYAQTLEAAGREFEVPDVLKTILASNPDPNTRATVMARLIELEQPKRVANIVAAGEKMEAGDFQGAISSLKPLRNWLADYWKLWMLLASAYNRTQQFVEAEDAGRRLLELFPGCEPAFGELVSALHGQGKNDEAYSLMQFAATNIPNSVPIHINLALAAKRAGQPDEARELAKRIREAVGPNEDLEPVLAEIER